jgi:hypothetical protein
LAIETAFAKELTGLQNCDDRFLALIGYDDDLDPAFLDVKNRIRDVALGENDLILSVFRYRFPGPDLGEKRFGLNPFFVAFPMRPSCGPRKIVKYKKRPGCSIQNSASDYAVTKSFDQRSSEWQFGEPVVHPPDTGIVIWQDFNVQNLEPG